MTTPMDPCLMPRYIQRLKHHPGKVEGAKGVDRFFRFDYMGSFEFECGTLPAAKKILRAMPRVGPLKIKAKRDTDSVTGWYVGPEEFREAAEHWFKTSVSSEKGERGFDLQERSGVYGSYGPEINTGGFLANCQNYDREYVGWFCVDGGYRTSRKSVWAIFRTKTDANNWVKGLNDPNVGKDTE